MCKREKKEIIKTKIISLKNRTNFYLSHKLYDFLNTFYPKKEMLFVSYMNIE